jgi:ABC-2 type transport system permease protein
MKKFLSIFRISFQQEFAYKLNFIMWRARNVMQILVFFFLWNAVFEGRTGDLLGYNKEKILTYAFMLLVIRAITLSSRSVDVSGQISRGELSNFLVKPVNFFKYWITRDLSSKFLNIIFSLLEITLLLIFLKPNLFFQTNFLYVIFFIISIIVAIVIFFAISMIISFIPFWFPEIAWGSQFLFIVVVTEFLSGSFFPLDVLPIGIYKILKITPFPYLVFVPIKIYLGNLNFQEILVSLGIGIVWCFILLIIMKKIWLRGLKVYEAVGK